MHEENKQGKLGQRICPNLRGWGPTEPQRCNTVKNIRYVHILLLSFAGVHVGVGVVPKLVLELISSFDILPQKIASILIAGNRDGDTPRFAFTLLQASNNT